MHDIYFAIFCIFRPSAVATNSKRTEIPKPSIKKAGHPSEAVEKQSSVMEAKKRTDINSNAYLHPQTAPMEFVPSNVVLRTLTPSPKSKCMRWMYDIACILLEGI